MGEYDNISKVYEWLSVVYEDCTFLAPDSIIYKELGRYVIFTSKQGVGNKKYYTDIKVNDKYEYLIAKLDGVWNMCNKYGDIMLQFSVNDINPLSYEDLIVWWNNIPTSFRPSILYRYENHKLIKLYTEVNGRIHLYPSLRVVKSTNYITNWDRLISLNGDLILDIKTKLVLTDDGYIISLDDDKRYIEIYKINNNSVVNEISFADKFSVVKRTKKQIQVTVFEKHNDKMIFDRLFNIANEL